MGRRRYTDDQLRAAVSASRTMREVLVRLGLAPYGGNYETTWRRISALKLDARHLRAARNFGRRLPTISDEEIAEAVRTSRSLAQVIAKVGIRPGGNQARLKGRIAAIGIDTTHLQGMAWRRGSSEPVVPRVALVDVLVKGRLTSTSNLRERLFSEGLKTRICEGCRRGTWRGRPIPLELDHVNGRRDDNRFENLRVLCPNCHAQTDTYRGKNSGLRRYSRKGPGAGTGETDRS